MSRDENFDKVIGKAYAGDPFGKQCEYVVHGFMDFISTLLMANSGKLESSIQGKGDKRQYTAQVKVVGKHGEEWELQVTATPPSPQDPR